MSVRGSGIVNQVRWILIILILFVMLMALISTEVFSGDEVMFQDSSLEGSEPEASDSEGTAPALSEYLSGRDQASASATP
ncbi:MAG: hypothetical protein IH860_04985 [Chloroflexi bacterium]|nr:hypothetical protein [Chloroflexota bacterium]